MISAADEQVLLLSKNIAGLCRICSGPGSHTLFAKIPPYLHEQPRECSRWTMPISRLVTEVTGIDITQNDGLPQKICVLCISYLKHAYTFRRQTIENIAALLAARYIVGMQGTQSSRGKDVDDDDLEDIPTMVRPVVVRANVNEIGGGGGGGKKANHQKKLDKEVLQRILSGNDEQKATQKQNNAEEEQRQIEEAYLSRLRDGSPDESAPTGVSSFFSYTEKQFEEDDVMELDVLKENNIAFNLPEDYKEKKCYSCRKRFMFDESLDEHLKECLQVKLVKFIQEVYHFLYLKENRSISSFEFIRRMVFSIRKTVQLIAGYDGDAEEDPEIEESPPVQFAEKPSKIDRSILKNLEQLRMNYPRKSFKSASPVAVAPNNDDGRSSFTTTGSTSISPVIVITTRCQQCDHTFQSVTELETHNLYHHRGRFPPPPTNTPLNNVKTPPTLFSQPPPMLLPSTPNGVEMIKNRLLSQTPESTTGTGVKTPDSSRSTSAADQRKMVKCSNCKKPFPTILHLDTHRVRCQQQQQRKSPSSASSTGNSRDSPLDRNRKNLNASYFYQMERLKDTK